MNINIPYSQMMERHRQAQGLKQGLLGYLLASKIRDFENENGIRIKSISDKHKEFIESWFETENDQIKHVTPPKEDGKPEPKPEPVFKEGKTREKFDEACKEFMSQVTVLKI